MGAARRERRRARRDEIDPAALSLIARHGAQVLATARRYSASLEDAEDAYQRALEILLTKAPTTREEELVPWLKTVVKHEAFAIRRQRERHTPTTDDGELAERTTADAATHDQAERWERLRLGAEAMGKLKPQEIRCLLLKAEGYSYKEICEVTGWSYTKVNRCLTEGRRAFLERVAGIEGGSECERLAPLVSLLADGELSSEELRLLRPHLKSCLACRARLREYRAAPQRVAALVPPLALAAGGADAGPLRSLLESLIGATSDRAAALGERLHAAGELATGTKVAAVAASAAAIAGGGTTVSQLSTPDRAPARDRPTDVSPVKEQTPAEPPRDEPVATTPASEQQAPTPAPEPSPAPEPEPAPPPPDPAKEFTPAPAPAPAPARPAPATANNFSPARGGGSGGGGEFGP
jgi:RNA polymerase sigma factor (sigma-70 family)